MLPAAVQGPGANLCAPDVCKTPPPIVIGVAVPYVNEALHCTAVPFSATTYVCMMPALFLSSVIPITQGDDPGIFGPGPKRSGKFVAGNPVVFIDMQPAVNLTCPATGNGANAAGAHLVPGPVNVFYCHASGAPVGLLRSEEVEALRAALDEAAPPAGAMLDDGIGHIRIAAFTADISTIVYNEVRRLTALGMRALILDVRGCPGGDLSAALGLAEDFLPAGAVLLRTIDDEGDETVHRGQREHPYEMPVAILVDRATASAAEVFAGCLQSYRRALIVGERTYGKGSVQRVVNGADGLSVHHATLAHCLFPGGEALDGAGVRPDIPA